MRVLVAHECVELVGPSPLTVRHCVPLTAAFSAPHKITVAIPPRLTQLFVPLPMRNPAPKLHHGGLYLVPINSSYGAYNYGTLDLSIT